MSDPRLPTQVKQPWEERIYNFDFRAASVPADKHLVPAGRTIASVDSVEVLASTPSGDTDLTAGPPTTDNDATVQAKFTGGTDGQDYPVRVRIVDDLGQRLEGDAIMQVRDL